MQSSSCTCAADDHAAGADSPFRNASRSGAPRITLTALGESGGASAALFSAAAWMAARPCSSRSFTYRPAMVMAATCATVATRCRVRMDAARLCQVKGRFVPHHQEGESVCNCMILPPPLNDRCVGPRASADSSCPRRSAARACLESRGSRRRSALPPQPPTLDRRVRPTLEPCRREARHRLPP